MPKSELPHGWSVFEAGEIGAIPDRHPSSVACEEDIGAIFHDGVCNVDARGRTWLICDYCGTTRQTTEVAAYHWFRDHECHVDATVAARNARIIEREQEKLAWDLGTSLPAGHPFAPVVDGKHAA